MRALRRQSFVLEQDAHHGIDGIGDVSFAAGGTAATREASSPKSLAQSRRTHPSDANRDARTKRKWPITGEPRCLQLATDLLPNWVMFFRISSTRLLTLTAMSGRRRRDACR